MVVTAEEHFISNFHSLSGTTIGERRKNLFLLLNKTRQSLEVTVGKIDFASLKPQTPLEENFKIESLIYFRNIPELLEVLKDGNPILIERILNANSWFIEQAFGKMSGEKLMTEIFPHLSYNTKLKLIHKLSLYLKDTQKADEYFEAIKKTYGVYLASKLLPACSDALIMKCIESYRIEVTPGQLLIIIKKYPALTENIFDKLDQYNSKINVANKYKYVFIYLVQHNVPLFLKLSEKYKPEIKLGSRASNAIINKEKENIIENPKKYYNLLKKERIGKTLKEDFSKVYLKLFPKSLNRLKEDLDCHLVLLKFLSSDEQKLKMLLMTFKAKHGNELWDHQVFIIPKLIKMMSPDEREIWMQTHSRSNEISEEEWISFMKIEKSVPLLKQKISFTSKIKERVKLVAFLVETCKINNDKVALLDVCKYMMDKHRNDHVTVREEFLSGLNSSFDLVELEDEHWKYINEFVTLCNLKGERVWVCSDILEKFIHYSFEKNLPVKQLLLEWVQREHGRYNICQKEAEYEKRCLLMFNETFPSAYKEVDLKCRYIEYLYSLSRWNASHPKDKISLFINSDAIDCLKSELEREGYLYIEEEIASACIVSDFKKSEEANLFELLLKRQNYSNLCKIMNWLLKKHPLILLNHVKSTTDSIIKTFYFRQFNTNLYRYYTHLEIPQKISELCQNAINIEDCTKKSAITVLSHTMEPEKFLNLPALHPSELSVDIKSKEGQDTYQLQRVILPCLKDMIPPSLALESVLKFCKGDYLSLIQRSLYSVSHNVPEKKLVPFFELLSERPVSVKKHAIFLGFKVLNKADSYKMLTKFMETEKNASIRKSLFKGIFNFFMRNPDDYSWELVKKSVKAVDVNDKEAFNILTKCRRIPSPYFVRYTLFTWIVLEEFENPNDVIEEGKCRILDSATPINISKLPKEFCEKIIEKYFLKSKELSNVEVKTHSFVCKYIIFYTSVAQQGECMESVFEILKKYIKSTWHDLNTSAIGRLTVSNFVKYFCSNFIDKKCLDKEILSKFATLWNDFLKPHEAFDEYLYLQFTLIHLECVIDKLTIPQIGEKIALLCNSLNDTGAFVTSIFCESLNLFKSQFLCIDEEENDENENKLLLIDSIVKSSSSEACLILAVSLLPNNILMAPSIKLTYEGIIQLVMKEPYPVVQIHLHHYLRNKV